MIAQRDLNVQRARIASVGSMARAARRPVLDQYALRRSRNVRRLPALAVPADTSWMPAALPNVLSAEEQSLVEHRVMEPAKPSSPARVYRVKIGVARAHEGSHGLYDEETYVPIVRVRICCSSCALRGGPQE